MRSSLQLVFFLLLELGKRTRIKSLHPENELGISEKKWGRDLQGRLLAQGLSTLQSCFPFNPVSAFFLSVPILQEIRQLQQKQASYIREISDLQETIEWKDKKIGVGFSSL